MASTVERIKNVAAQLVDGFGAVIAVILLAVLAVLLVLVLVNSCIDTPNAGDDFGLFIHASP